MKIKKRITAIILCVLTAALLSMSAFAEGIGMSGTANTTVGDSGSGNSGSDSSFGGMGSMGGMSGGMSGSGAGSDSGKTGGTSYNDSTLGDIDGDGFIENENGANPGNTDQMGRDGSESPDGVLNTTGDTDSENGTMPIAETDEAAGEGEDGAMSWTAIIRAVLLAAALVAVVIALIPKKKT